MEKLYTVRLGADCGLDHELPIAKFSLKLKKSRKTTRPFRYDLNQIPYDYTVDVTNRLNRLDLVDRVPENYEQRFIYCIGGGDQNNPKEKEMQEGKVVV